GGGGVAGSGEALLSDPTDVAVDHRGRVLVPDYEQGCVFVFDEAGNYLGRLGRRGEGPGEMMHPGKIAVSPWGVFVAEGCCRIHEFDGELRWVRSAPWPVEILPFQGWACFRGVVLVTQSPLPPDRSNVVQIYTWDEGGVYPVASFLPYAKPRKTYGNPVAALSSRNVTRLATGGDRYVAIYRNSEREITLVDVPGRAAWRYVLKGHKVRTEPRRDTPVPRFAGVRVVGAMAFDGQDTLFALMP
ncbi:MAG: 6-bladed beta-propeller, partial [candidate division KSB1 bacterium]|nr:6-bladed beta-propeller [candidate division KSB1 bacterium]